MRALVVSLQYNDFENAKLNGCYYDGERIITQLKKMDRKIKIVNMRDDLEKSSNLFPTRYNILRELKNMMFLLSRAYLTEDRPAVKNVGCLLPGPKRGQESGTQQISVLCARRLR